jgi:cytidine deaminase
MTPDESALLREARNARDASYAPYSRFHVGAALQGADGVAYTGCNVENASYGLTSCAERGAVQAAVVGGCRSFGRLALSTDGPAPVAPCGACRQVLAEFAPELDIVSEAEGEVRRWTLGELLPARFEMEDLRRAGAGPLDDREERT